MSVKKFHAGRFEYGAISNDSIKSVSLMTIGEARGHDMMIDMQTLTGVLECCQQYASGVRVNADHYSGILSAVGYVKNFRIDGDQLKADLYLFDSDPVSKGKIIEMAQLIPDTWGFSMSFSGMDEDINDVLYARCEEVFSADLVTDPAANDAGVFSTKLTPQKTSMSKTYTLNETELSEAISKAIAPHMEALTGHGKQLDDMANKVNEVKGQLADHQAMCMKKFEDITAKITPESATPTEKGGNEPDPGSEEGNKATSANITKKDLEALEASLKEGILKSFAAAGHKGEIIKASIAGDAPKDKSLEVKKFEEVAREEHKKWQADKEKINLSDRPQAWSDRMNSLQNNNPVLYKNYLDRRSGKIEGGIEPLINK